MKEALDLLKSGSFVFCVYGSPHNITFCMYLMPDLNRLCLVMGNESMD